MKRAALIVTLLAGALAVAGQARAEKQIVFPQGSEQPLAALQDIDVIEHLGEKIPSGLTFTDAAASVMLSEIEHAEEALDGITKPRRPS